MTKHSQITKNMEFSQELMNYLIAKKIKIKPNSSYVVFTYNDENLNKMNVKLLNELVKEGKKVIKAMKTNDSENPWKFTPIN